MITASSLLRHAAWVAKQSRDARWHPVGVWLEAHDREHDTYECDSDNETDDCPALDVARALLYGPTPDSPAELEEEQ